CHLPPTRSAPITAKATIRAIITAPATPRRRASTGTAHLPRWPTRPAPASGSDSASGTGLAGGRAASRSAGSPFVFIKSRAARRELAGLPAALHGSGRKKPLFLAIDRPRLLSVDRSALPLRKGLREGSVRIVNPAPRGAPPGAGHEEHI